MSKTKKLCRGCRNDYYNQNRDGGCWSFAEAKVVKRQRVGTWQPLPYSWHPETVLGCYHADGCSMLCRDDPRIEETKKA
jgi:hypothetical protein